MTERPVQRDRARADPEPDVPSTLFRRFAPEVRHRTSGEILAHPDYRHARRIYIAHTRVPYELANFPGGLQGTAYHVVLLATLICLHCACDPEDRATWPTASRLKEALSAFNLSSARQIDDVLVRLSETGYIVSERTAADGRLRLLRPTERLLAWDRTVLEAYYAILHRLYPEPGYGPALAMDPAFQRAQRSASIRFFPLVARFLYDNTPLVPFYAMYRGLTLLMGLADRKAADPEAPVRERDFAELKDRFGISRSHIRNILVAAEQGGLLTRPSGDRRSIDLTPLGLASIDRYIADTLSSHDFTCAVALGAMRARPRDAA